MNLAEELLLFAAFIIPLGALVLFQLQSWRGWAIVSWVVIALLLAALLVSHIDSVTFS